MDRITLTLYGLDAQQAVYELVDFEVVEELVDFYVEDSLEVEEVSSASA